MITGELKSKVDRIWNTMWSGGISNPLSVIEQLTYLLFIKGLDELHTRKEHKAARTGNPIEEPVFAAHQDGLRWSRFKELAPEQMFETVRDRVFPFIKSMGQTGDPGEGSTYSHHMQDALFMMPTARVLANVVDQLDAIDMADRDTKGDLYEYMLGKIATAGQNGQFRTPRHIIKLMVDMSAPTPKDVICDPACGTAGFLVAASEHLVEHHGDRIYKDAQARRRFNEGTFHGYDFDTTMLRIGSMNMLLHGIENPDIRYRDSLAQFDLAAAGDDAERYSLVLANPPFAGSLDYESTARDLQQVVNLVFFKPVYSRIKFWQMIGRGTRLCPELFGPGDDKHDFRVFDFFREQPEGIEGGGGVPLHVRLFRSQVQLLANVRAVPDLDPEAALAGALTTELHREVAAMNRENFIVRMQLEAVERFQRRESWERLTASDVETLQRDVAGLPSEIETDDIESRLFDLSALKMQLAFAEGDAGTFEHANERLRHAHWIRTTARDGF